MARSAGYRANKENEAKIAKLRSKLGKCRSDQWQRATHIMQDIANLTSKHDSRCGPSGGKVEPRACKYCSYFGHTKQHCAKRIRDDEIECERIIQKDYAFRMGLQLAREQEQVLKELPWYQRAKQSDWFDEMGVLWYKDARLGPMPGVP